MAQLYFYIINSQLDGSRGRVITHFKVQSIYTYCTELFLPPGFEPGQDFRQPGPKPGGLPISLQENKLQVVQELNSHLAVLETAILPLN